MSEAQPADLGNARVVVSFKWNGKVVDASVPAQETVGGLKRELEQQTSVQMKKQKLLGLKTAGGKPATDDTPVAELAIKPNQKFMMMG